MSRKTSDLDVLREILLAQDREVLEKLQKEVEALKAKIEDPGEFLRVIEPVISEAIAHRSRTHPEEVAEALAPAIADAVKYQIKENRDAMITALMPIIGALIARSVREAFQALARRVDERLREATSVQALLKRIWARIRGIPPEELILREALPWKSAAVFLIDNESGLILAQAQKEDALSGRDPHLTAALLTAIRNFARETFANGEPGTVYELQIDKYTVLMEEGPDVYMAWVGIGVPPEEAHHHLRSVLAEIYTHYQEDLRDPQRRRTLTSAIEPYLEQLLTFEDTGEPAAQGGAPTLGLAIVTGALMAVLFLCSWGVYRASPHILAHLMPTAVSYLTPTPTWTPTPSPTPQNTPQATFTPTPHTSSWQPNVGFVDIAGPVGEQGPWVHP